MEVSRNLEILLNFLELVASRTGTLRHAQTLLKHICYWFSLNKLKKADPTHWDDHSIYVKTNILQKPQQTKTNIFMLSIYWFYNLVEYTTYVCRFIIMMPKTMVIVIVVKNLNKYHNNDILMHTFHRSSGERCTLQWRGYTMTSFVIMIISAYREDIFPMWSHPVDNSSTVRSVHITVYIKTYS